MGEKSVLNVHAHVFQIDPDTKKKWLPSSTSSVRVAYYHDPNRKTYRIIAIEQGKALINSTVTANMTFTKTSPKFGQWSDHRANTVFGLGFSSEKDLALFAEKFGEAKSAAKALLEERKKQKSRDAEQSSPSHQISSGATINESGETNNIEQSVKLGDSETSVSNGTNETPVKPAPDDDVTSDNQESLQLSSSKVQPSSEQQLEVLKFENSKLKVALASSAQNVKKWETEMQTLRNNNTMLTTALEESTQHVTEWKRQLQKYKEECDQLKRKVLNLEAAQNSLVSPHDMESIKQENDELKQTLSAVQVKYEKEQKIVQSLEKNLATTNQQFKDVTNEKLRLEKAVKDLEDELRLASQKNETKISSVYDKQTQLGQQLEQVMNLHKDIIVQLQN